MFYGGERSQPARGGDWEYARPLPGIERPRAGAGGGREAWPPAPQGARYPLAHLRQEHVEAESFRMVSEVLKALRPFPEARRAVRERFAELFPREP